MLRLTPFVLLFVFTIMRAPAGEVHYEPTEDTMACADMVVIAKQSGDIGKFTPQSDERRTHKEVFDSDFEVLRVIKKCNLAKDPKVIRIHGTEQYAGGAFYQSFEVNKNDVVIAYLRAPPAAKSEWTVLHTRSAFGILKSDMKGRAWYEEEAHSDAEAVALGSKGPDEILKRLQALRDRALKEMQEFDSATVIEAMTLLPEVEKACREIPTINDSLPELKDGIWKKLREARLPLIRAVSILLYPDGWAPVFDSIVAERVKAAKDWEFQAACKWLALHFKHLNEDEGVRNFALSHREAVLTCFSTFPMLSGGESWGIGLRGQCAINLSRDLEAETDLERTIRFLILSEDPGCYEFLMIPGWGIWSRAAKLGQPPKPYFGKLNLQHVQDLLSEWLKPEADERLNRTALYCLNENPGTWTRNWVESEMQKISDLPAKERRIRSCNLVAPLAGLDDAAAIVKLWQGLIKDDNNIFEWTFMWWLRAVGYLHPDIVEMAVSRWQAAQDLTDRNKEAQTAASQFEDYVNNYRLEIGGKDTTRIESPAAARNWLDSLKKQKNSLRNEQALDKR